MHLNALIISICDAVIFQFACLFYLIHANGKAKKEDGVVSINCLGEKLKRKGVFKVNFCTFFMDFDISR